MKKILTTVLLLIPLGLFAQKSISEQTEAIVKEGKLLYRSEISSWYGTDIFLENYQDRENVGGYFSYTENNISKCVFFSKTKEPSVIGTITFDSTYNPNKANLNLSERQFTDNEKDIYEIREITIQEIQSDTLFKTYKNTNLNLIPLISENEKKVYILTGPEQNGVVIFGNDYLLRYDKDNKLIEKKQLHKNIIPIYYEKADKEAKKNDESFHNHSQQTGDFITATDICTLMLYSKIANWKLHNVVSKNYLNVWNCETAHLTVVSMEVVNKINKDQKKRNKKKKIAC